MCELSDYNCNAADIQIEFITLVQGIKLFHPLALIFWDFLCLTEYFACSSLVYCSKDISHHYNCLNCSDMSLHIVTSNLGIVRPNVQLIKPSQVSEL